MWGQSLPYRSVDDNDVSLEVMECGEIKEEEERDKSMFSRWGL